MLHGSLPTRRALVSAAALLSAPRLPAHAISRWSLPNGEVSLREPSFACGGSSYEAPILLGAGGSGAALSVSPSSSRPAVKGERVVLKVSWSSPGAAAAVRNEGAVLERLNGVNGVERLLGRCDYTAISGGGEPGGSGRVALLLSPLVEDAVDSIGALTDARMQEAATAQLASTVIAILAANVCSTDLQLLIDRRTAALTVIDLTEARVMASPPSDADLAQAASFATEARNQVPARWLGYFQQRAREEAAELARRRGPPADPEVLQAALDAVAS
ncbi:hypothetical protein EMIHUDRAFT_456772 [Emiliania huxleyi CCMP1516]|uniref:Protein kinase domain-containing protein n=2 Tax=Emiliania huxleyi TaxID=2903 RepID=A0A0D3K1E7_EMIH1|nr:hypothetical protein EMIHUDRAFT_456772 [Emiliania huxleyi CCMP1516]EOD29582.1 hypothetical protein EMIHUDRAFT_456772 [Emiliania huxleyi CCMP1516]|eukprot:XP_005782011.1 hypothetical protein EMIHUDRAFT_456772 [Emiliania huxleyi CCMP1516]